MKNHKEILKNMSKTMTDKTSEDILNVSLRSPPTREYI